MKKKELQMIFPLSQYLSVPVRLKKFTTQKAKDRKNIWQT